MLTIGPFHFDSHLLVGTGKYQDFEQMRACHLASGTSCVTVALRRVDLSAPAGANILDFIDQEHIQLLPNTSGCYDAEDALTTARLARELLNTPLIKLEVIGCAKTLFPDNAQTVTAAKQLVKEGFVVMPYCSDDPVVCQQLEDVGCAAVMPLAAPIGSGLGVRNPYNLQMIRELVSVPLIVDAGVGTASDAALAMELGADGVLLNTAIAASPSPVKMAEAMRHAVIAGRLAYQAGRMERKLYAAASSPLSGVIRR